VGDLLATGMLVEVNKFGKFVHGLAVLMPSSRVKELPYWFNQVNLDDTSGSSVPAAPAEQRGIELDAKRVAGSAAAKEKEGTKEGAAAPARPAIVRHIYSPPEPGPLVKLSRFFLRMSGPEPFQKVITGKLVVEPKVYFANERTFLTWSSLCVQLGSIAIGILAISYHRPNIMRVGIILGGLTTIFFVYALAIFLMRAHGLRVRSTDAPYDDRFGPTLVAAVMIVSLLSNAYISISEEASAASISGAQ